MQDGLTEVLRALQILFDDPFQFIDHTQTTLHFRDNALLFREWWERNGDPAYEPEIQVRLNSA